MTFIKEQMRDIVAINEKVIRAADNGYLAESKDELQLNILCQLTLALLTVAEAIEHKANRGK